MSTKRTAANLAEIKRDLNHLKLRIEADLETLGSADYPLLGSPLVVASAISRDLRKLVARTDLLLIAATYEQQGFDAEALDKLERSR